MPNIIPAPIRKTKVQEPVMMKPKATSQCSGPHPRYSICLTASILIPCGNTELIMTITLGIVSIGQTVPLFKRIKFKIHFIDTFYNFKHSKDSMPVLNQYSLEF